MNKWTLLGVAIAAEVTATMSLRAAVDAPGWYALTAAGYGGAFVALSALLRRGAPIGVVYGIWAAAGVALTAVLGAIIFGESLSVATALGIAIIIGGVLLVEMGHQPDRAEVSR